ncbi:mechanosensitive ion channel family protein [Metabacillus malikii]|uniref:Miniconductance mechanosensitive channel n=1 Tax=Metabacillus malikii TaxID=1504265 RepID=A0ABT9ZMF8_9BACI|nr:mechanosensitive ion channel family protein [Metabacillus malikii]MDQ0233468.1 miniconductance mechanosensitive channel [Metabacillus malikii]
MKFIENMLESSNMNPTVVNVLSNVLMIVFIAIVAIIANFLTKKIVIKIISQIVRKNKFQWDDILFERKVFHRLSHFVPAIIIYSFAETFPAYEDWIQKGAVTYIIIISLLMMNNVFNAINDIYQTYDISKVRPIKGYLQVIEIVAVTLGIILIIANLIGKSPLLLLSGIGALSAVFMLVFKDSLLGLVAGIQLTSNDMVRVGDWIEMPKYGADGDIIDISLNTVKVQNWDKTIVTIPSYALISDSFKNWRGMQNSGGRRIKRSVFIDSSSISFCTAEMMEKFKYIHYLSDYIVERENEIAEYNRRNDVDRSNRVNGRALTNIGVFRAYIDNYLKHHPGINQDMTLMVRQLAPTEHGLPLEIYCFTNDIRWAVYESIQGDIFDHIFAVAPEFGLQIFQSPSGSDLRALIEETKKEEEMTRELGH